jgi:hypothetical protein
MQEFPPFQLDTANQCLWHHRETAPTKRLLLTPKAFAVLPSLVEHVGRLVTQEALLEAVWPETYIEPEVLKSRLFEVRSALGDRPRRRALWRPCPGVDIDSSPRSTPVLRRCRQRWPTTVSRLAGGRAPRRVCEVPSWRGGRSQSRCAGRLGLLASCLCRVCAGLCPSVRVSMGHSRAAAHWSVRWHEHAGRGGKHHEFRDTSSTSLSI